MLGLAAAPSAPSASSSPSSSSYTTTVSIRLMRVLHQRGASAAAWMWRGHAPGPCVGIVCQCRESVDASSYRLFLGPAPLHFGLPNRGAPAISRRHKQQHRVGNSQVILNTHGLNLLSMFNCVLLAQNCLPSSTPANSVPTLQLPHVEAAVVRVELFQTVTQYATLMSPLVLYISLGYRAVRFQS
jgi:hypothetical protein